MAPIQRFVDLSGVTRWVGRLLPPSGGSQNLDNVLATGNDAGAQQIKNVTDGTDPQDAATVAQLPAPGVTNPLSVDLQTANHAIRGAGGVGSETGAAMVAGDAGGGVGGVAYLAAGAGTIGAQGGAAFIAGGTGDTGASTSDGAQVIAEGGHADGSDGRAQVYTLASYGLPGEALVSAGDALGTVWGGVIVAAGVPAGAPNGKLPFAFDTTAVTGGFYFWNGAAWVKIATIL